MSYFVRLIEDIYQTIESPRNHLEDVKQNLKRWVEGIFLSFF